MAGLCESIISSGIGFDCANPLVKGIEANGILINRNDVDFANCSFDETNKNVLKQLVLKSGKKGFEVIQMGATPFNGVKTSMTVGTYRNTFNHDCPLVVLDNGPEVAQNIIDGLANGSFVLILRNVHKGKNGMAEYQVYGFYQGLKANAIDNDKYSQDTDGGWLVTLQETSVPKSALFLFNTNTETTEAAVKSLITSRS